MAHAIVSVPDDETENAIPVVVYKPSQLYVDGDPAKGFLSQTTGTPGITTWSGLVSLLGRATEGDPKRYKDPNVEKSARGGWTACSLQYGRRLAKAFIETRLLGLDIDTNGDVDRALEAFGPFKKIVHATYKSTATAPRCRVILMLKEPCRDAARFRHAHQAIRRAVVHAGHFHANDFDDAGSDPSRLWFLPMVPPGTEYRFRVTDGELLDIEKLVPHVDAKPPSTNKPHRKAKGTSAALVWAERKLASASEGHRHKTAFSTAAWLAEVVPPIANDEIVNALLPHTPASRAEEFERTIVDGIRCGRSS